MIVVDTNVWSEIYKPNPDSNVVNWIKDNASRLYITVTSVHELLYGARLVNNPRKRSILQRQTSLLLENFGNNILEYNLAAAIKHADLRASMKAQGQALTSEDGQIAATTIVHDASLATRNIKDFEPTGVRLINPWDGRSE